MEREIQTDREERRTDNLRMFEISTVNYIILYLLKIACNMYVHTH